MLESAPAPVPLTNPPNLGVPMSRKRPSRRRREHVRSPIEPVSESCPATWGEPSGSELGCDKPAGHEGAHHVEWEWECDVPPARLATSSRASGAAGWTLTASPSEVSR